MMREKAAREFETVVISTGDYVSGISSLFNDKLLYLVLTDIFFYLYASNVSEDSLS